VLNRLSAHETHDIVEHIAELLLPRPAGTTPDVGGQNNIAELRQGVVSR
jgi:hypothetical protein